ncbi:MAG: efflux RND transporter periplasmic adaptor subunit [Verrucomicrobiota bacterium]
MTNLQRILNLVLLPLIVLLALFFVRGMIASKPERQVRKPPVVIPSVTYIEAMMQDIAPAIRTYGNVRSFFEAQLSAQVAGEIITVADSFNSGQIINKGDVLVEIDPSDYLAIIAREESALASSKQSLSEEKTRSQLAAVDWVESGRALKDATDLTLRKPQLVAAEAAVASARATLEKAKLDLDRTKIRAPFDAIVQSRTTSLGNYVNIGSSVGVLVAKERAEVRLPLTPEQIRRIDLPMKNSSGNTATSHNAELSTPTQPGVNWSASIIRTEPSVDPQNQVVYVIGEIEDPFEDPNAFLPIGAFVDAVIDAKVIEAAYSIPNKSLVEDSFIWVIDANESLKKQPVTRVFADADNLIVKLDQSEDSGLLRVATRPLASFREEQTVKPILSDQ